MSNPVFDNVFPQLAQRMGYQIQQPIAGQPYVDVPQNPFLAQQMQQAQQMGGVGLDQPAILDRMRRRYG